MTLCLLLFERPIYKAHMMNIYKTQVKTMMSIYKAQVKTMMTIKAINKIIKSPFNLLSIYVIMYI